MNIQITTPTAEQPDYLVVDGEITCNQAAADLNKAFNDLEQQKQLLAQSCAGATILHTLVSIPSLQSFSLTFNGEYEYNDEGYTTCLCRNGNVQDVVTTDESGKTEIELEELFDNTDAYSDIYDVLTEPDECTSFDIKVDRSKVAHLLESGNLSGSEAFKIFLSEEALNLHT